MNDGLVAALEAKRLSLRMTARDFASYLGIHWVTYYKLRGGGKLPARITFYNNLLARFPDLGAEVQLSIRDRVQQIAEVIDEKPDDQAPVLGRRGSR